MLPDVQCLKNDCFIYCFSSGLGGGGVGGEEREEG